MQHSLDEFNMPIRGSQNDRVFPDVTDEQLDELYDLVRGDRARQSHLHYLEHEPLTLTLANGKTWKIYGSPVSMDL